MPQPINSAQIARLKDLASIGKTSEVYTWLAGKGYQYPLLARGVVNSDTLSGVSALTFMDKQAAKQGHALSSEQEGRIKQDMANAYLDLLAYKAKKAGMVNSEISYKEAWKFHNSVFEKNGLLPSTWTLDTPLSIIEKSGGPAAAQKYWENLLKRGQDPVAGTIDSLATQTWMAQIATYGKTPELKQQAKDWLDAVPNVASPVVTAEMLARLVLDGYVSPSLVNLSQMMKDLGSHLMDRLEYSVVRQGDVPPLRDSHQGGNGLDKRPVGAGAVGEATIESIPLRNNFPSGRVGSAARRNADDQHSLQRQLLCTDIQADDHQRIMVAQNLVNIGVREVSFHPISESSVGVVNSKGITVGHLEKKSDGSIRYADNNENGFEISVSGRSQHVLRGRSEDERHLADQVKPDIDSFRAHHRVVRR
ncbi:hypothetical protein Hsc_2856 [Herbaspirillum seropedicae]|nr:hypothetical protein Hsc_2856 [Herbaspirillum seropedicae]